MNPLRQYLDFYDANAELIAAHSAPVLNDRRPEARAALREATLPAKGAPGYDIQGIDTLFEPDYGINASRLSIAADTLEPFRCEVPNLSTWLGFQVNDSYIGGSMRQLPDGVMVGSLGDAAREFPDVVARHYARIAPLDDAQVALSTLLAQDGICIYVPRGVKLAKPVQIVNILSGNVPIMASRRLLIVIDDEAEAQLLLCDHTQSSAPAMLINEVVEVAVGARAALYIYDLEQSTPATRRVASLWARQAEGSSLHHGTVTLTNGITRNNLHVAACGNDTETRLLGLAIAKERQVVDNHTTLVHQGLRGRSNQLFKYFVGDEGRGSFIGRVKVAPGAAKVEAYQSNKNIVATATARVHSKPELEIYCDDVKCSHGSSTGQLDADAIFYMRQRGIPEAMARMMLVQAFLSDVTDAIDIPALATRLRQLTEQRLGNVKALCGDCKADCHNPINPKQ